MGVIGIAWCFVVALVYLSAVYLTKNARGDRNSSTVIKARLVNVAASTALSVAVVVALYIRDGYTLVESLSQLGLSHLHLRSIALVPLLYLGHILQLLLTRAPLVEPLNIIFLRNIVVAPVTEELCYRLCVVSLLRLDSEPHSNTAIVLLSPLFFGLSHLHHGVMSYMQHKSIVRSLVSTAVQFAYTSLFGSFAAFLYLRTASIYTCIISHSLCNYLGLPLIGEVRYIQGSHKKAAVSLAYAAGMALFAYLLWPLTASDHSLWVG